MAQNRCISCMNTIDSPVCPHCGHPVHQNDQTHQLPVGTMLRGRYQLGRVLGQGGFGITYIAWDTLMENVVAVKEFYPSNSVNRNTADSPTVHCNTAMMAGHYEASKERFLREAKALVRFRAIPEVVDILDFMEENNTAYIVMEFVRGVDLAKYIQGRGGKLSADETFRILKPVMEALAAVHKEGIVHRDISPDNIILDPMGGAKLLDFGAVRTVEDPSVDKALNKSTEAILKHGFAPLEQYNSRGSLGPWTDEYAMCATVFYCLTGRIPEEASLRVTEGIDPDWDSIEGLSPHQKRVLAKGMAVRAKDRYPGMDALMEALFNAPASQAAPQPMPVPAPAVPTAPAFEPTAAMGTSPVQPPVRQYRSPAEKQPVQATKKKKKLWPVLAAIAAVLAVAILAGVLLPGLIGGASGKDDRISERETESGKSEKQTAPSSDSDPAPAPAPDPEPADLLDLLLVEPGKLTVAVSPDFAPMEFVDPSKSGQERFVGLDMSFARFLASEMGLELVLMPMSFDGCQEAVYDGRVDLAISAFSWTAERDSIYSLSNAYSVDTEPNGLIVMATEASRFRTSEDLSNAVIAVQAGSLQESLCEAQLPNAKRIPVDTIEEGIALLKSGQVTAVADNTAHARYIITEDPSLAVSDFLFLDDGGNVILMKKGHAQLTARVNELIALAYEEDLFTAWMETVKNIDGIEVSYDDNGDPIN